MTKGNKQQKLKVTLQHSNDLVKNSSQEVRACQKASHDLQKPNTQSPALLRKRRQNSKDTLCSLKTLDIQGQTLVVFPDVSCFLKRLPRDLKVILVNTPSVKQRADKCPGQTHCDVSHLSLSSCKGTRSPHKHCNQSEKALHLNKKV